MTTRVLRFRVTREEWTVLREEADATGVPISTLVRYAIADWVESIATSSASASTGPACPTPRPPRP